MLTTHRLLCVNQRPEGGVELKPELSLRKGSAGMGVEKVVCRIDGACLLSDNPYVVC